MILASFREVFRAGTAKGFMILVKYILHKAGTHDPGTYDKKKEYDSLERFASRVC